MAGAIPWGPEGLAMPGLSFGSWDVHVDEQCSELQATWKKVSWTKTQTIRSIMRYYESGNSTSSLLLPGAGDFGASRVLIVRARGGMASNFSPKA